MWKKFDDEQPPSDCQLVVGMPNYNVDIGQLQWDAKICNPGDELNIEAYPWYFVIPKPKNTNRNTIIELGNVRLLV